MRAAGRPHAGAVLVDARGRATRPRRCASGSPTSRASIAFLCQGEDQISTLVRQFARDPRTCLFGTLIAVAGRRRARLRRASSSSSTASRSRAPTTRSPRRARRPSRAWAATASWRSRPRTRRCGSRRAPGRLIRRGDDRGVVAFLDSRMMTARYAGFLQRSLPPFWPTTDGRWCWPRSSASTRRRRRAACRCADPALSRRRRGASPTTGARRRRTAPGRRPPATGSPVGAHRRHPGPRVDPRQDEELRDGGRARARPRGARRAPRAAEDVIAARLRARPRARQLVGLDPKATSRLAERHLAGDGVVAAPWQSGVHVGRGRSPPPACRRTC